MKKHITTWLLILSIFIAESHSYVGAAGEEIKNWGWTVKWNIPLKWHIKYLADEINAIIYFVAMLFYTPNRVNKTTVITFIILCIVDLIMYFHNYKTLHYGSVYVWSTILWGFVYKWSVIKMQTLLLWKKLKLKTVRKLKKLDTHFW